MKAYIASGWFNPEWLQEVEDIKSVLDDQGYDYFSPKDVAIAPTDAGQDVQKAIFKGNVDALHDVDFVLVNSRNKDMGTIFEAGYSHAIGKPIVYFAAGLPDGAKFNLMLSQSGIKVCTSLEELDDYLARSATAGELLVEMYGGSIE